MAQETTVNYGWLKDRNNKIIIPGIAPAGNSTTPIYVNEDGQTATCSLKKLKFGTSGQEYNPSGTEDIIVTAADLGITGALIFLGTSSTEITNGGTQNPTVDNVVIQTSKILPGNVILHKGKEFVWAGGKWELLGDEGSYALKTIEIKTDGVALTGGGSLETTRTISHDKEYGATNTIVKYTSANNTTSVQGSGASGTVKIPQIKVDEYGHVVSASDENIEFAMPDLTNLENKTWFIEEADKENGITKILNHVEITESLDVNKIKMADSQFIFSGNPDASGNANMIAKIDENGITATNFNGKVNGFTIAKDLLSTAELTDTKVTSAANHYTPTTNTASTLNVDASSTTSATWGSTDLVTGVTIQRDAKGHVTGLSVDSIQMPASPTGLISVTNAGSGNAVTSGSYKDGAITLTKGSTFKTQQTAKTDPTASGNSSTFIDTISQNTNGEITATKKNVQITIDAKATDDDIVILTPTDGTNAVTYDAKHAKKGPASNYTKTASTKTTISGSAGSGTITVPKITVDTYGHVTAATDENIAITLPGAASTTLGLVKQDASGDVNISNGIITVKDDSHNHTTSNVDGLDNTLNDITNRIQYITSVDTTNGITNFSNSVSIAEALDVNKIVMNDNQFIFSDNPNASGEANMLAKIDSAGITANNFNGTATNANNVKQNLTSSNAEYPLLLAPNGQTATATKGTYFDSGVTLNPNTNTITATNFKGNATTATNFKSAKKIKLTGDVSGEASDTGANGWSITTVVADDSHNHIISNIDNLQSALDGKQPNITGGASTIASQNLTTNRALISNSSGKVAVSDITNTELNYLDGVTSNIQTQLNSKQATITGGASSITGSNLTASRALVSDSSGKVAVSAVTSTELGYLDGVTSAVQTQLNNLGTRATALETKTQYIKDVNTSTGYTNFLNNVSIAKKLEVGEGFVLNDDEFTFCDNPDASGNAEIIARINADGITATNFIGDGRVNKVAHHYKPDKNGITVTHSHVASNNAAWGSTNLITQIKTDLAGHVTGVTSAKLPANPDTGATSVEVVGDGNAVTTASYNSSNRKLTLTKGVDYQPAGNYKTTQTAVSDPTASGTSNTFISSISQDANGKITATKATVPVVTSNLSAYLPLTGGNMTGHIYMIGSKANPTQLIFGPSTAEQYVAVSAKNKHLIISPSVDDDTNQIELSTIDHSYFPKSIRLGNVYLNPDSSGVGIVLAANDGSAPHREQAIILRNTTSQFNNISANEIDANKVTGAVWNDYAEYRQPKDIQEIPYGRVIIENGDDTLSLSTDRLQPGGNICSDTFGFAIGETEQAKMPIAVSGRVLAYPAEDRNSYCAGDAVCTGPNGTVSKMTREEIREWPDRIIGYVSAIPNYETWGQNNVSVDGRIWIKVI